MSVPAILTKVNLSSGNPTYPENNIDVYVDNDLNSDYTVVVPNTYFPYVIEITGNIQAIGKRYISEWMYQNLVADYSTPMGRVTSNLSKDATPFSYYTLDWDTFTKKRDEEANKTGSASGSLLLAQNGAILRSFDRTTPEQLIKWIDFPVKTGGGTPIKNFPTVLDYAYYVKYDVITHRFTNTDTTPATTEYQISVTSSGPPVTKDAKVVYDSVLTENPYIFSGSNSKANTNTTVVNSVKPNDTTKSIQNVLSAITTGIALGISATAIAGNMLQSAKDAEAKIKALQGLAQHPPERPKFPKIEISKFVIELKAKLSRKKDIKRKLKVKHKKFKMGMPHISKEDMTQAAKALQAGQKIASLAKKSSELLKVAKKTTGH